MENLVGRKLGAYEVHEKIGKGGMAVVYKAYHPATDRHVAIKVISTDIADDPTFHKRFDREAKVVAGLQHVHILSVFDYGQEKVNHEEIAYLVMPYITGGTLSERLKAHSPTLQETGRLFRQMAEALDYAHQQGILHRDIKPGNVLIDASGNTLLSDFGLTRMMSGDEDLSKLTQSAIVGTPAYMSPEQGQGLSLDGRSDLYSLGVILYEMLLGDVPFRAETPVAVIFKHVSDPLPPITELRPDIPLAIVAVVEKALEKNPADRYATAIEMADALDAAMADNVSTAGFARTEVKRKLAGMDEARTLAASSSHATATSVSEMDTEHDSAKPTAILRTQTTLFDIPKKWRMPIVGIVIASVFVLVGVFGIALDGDNSTDKTDEAAASSTLTATPSEIADNSTDKTDETAASSTPAIPSEIAAHDGTVIDLAFSPNGSQVLSGGSDNVARMWDLATGEQAFELEAHSGDVLSVAYSPDGEQLHTGGKDGMSYTWTADRGSQLIMDMEGSQVNDIIYSKSGRYFTMATDRKFYVFPLATDGDWRPALIDTELEQPIFALAFHPDENLVAAGIDAGVLLWNLELRKVAMTLKGHNGMVLSLAFNAGGDLLASADENGLVIVWETASQTIYQEFEGYGSNVQAIAFHPTQNYLAIGGEGGEILLWDVDEDREIQTFAGHTGATTSLAFSPDGEKLISGGRDGFIRIWDTGVN